MMKQAQEKEQGANVKEGFDVDKMIEELLSVRTKNPGPNAIVNLDINDIDQLIDRAKELIEN